ncbi:MAG: hypothetical protein HC905_28775 [Bacteroidales bacterium]|nr:hypothetical protein [Bacteroidales bacterium]
MYKLSKLLFEPKIARFAAILFMFYPISWYYSAVLLKENLMVILIIESLYNLVKLQIKFKFKLLIKLLFFIVVLFFFRSAVSILLIFVSIFTLFIQTQNKKWVINLLFAFLLIAGYWLFLQSTGKVEDYYEQYTEAEEFGETRLKHGSEINSYFEYAGAPIYLGISFFAPFPSIVKVPIEGGLPHNEYYYHVAGNFYWLILGFFSLIGLYQAIRYHRQLTVAIWSFVLGYQMILIQSVMFSSVRFSFPVKPFMLIMAAFGIYRLKNHKWFTFYLVITFFMVIGWNYIRLKRQGWMKIFVVTGRLGENLVYYKTLPIANLPVVDEVIVFCERPLTNFHKVRYITIPGWIFQIKFPFIRRIIRIIYEPVQLIYFAFKWKPFIINGVYTLPKGLNSLIASKLTSTKCIISVLGGKEEIEPRFFPQFFWKKINLWQLKSANAITTKGQNDVNYLLSLGLKNKKIFPFNGFIDTIRFFPQPFKDIDVILLVLFMN